MALAAKPTDRESPATSTALCCSSLTTAWKRHVELPHPIEYRGRVVPLEFTASAGSPSLGCGWKGSLGLSNGGDEYETFDKAYPNLLCVLNDFGSFVGYLGVTVAAGAIAGMASVSAWSPTASAS